jgi:hypothetical protein
MIRALAFEGLNHGREPGSTGLPKGLMVAIRSKRTFRVRSEDFRFWVKSCHPAARQVSARSRLNASATRPPLSVILTLIETNPRETPSV